MARGEPGACANESRRNWASAARTTSLRTPSRISGAKNWQPLSNWRQSTQARTRYVSSSRAPPLRITSKFSTTNAPPCGLGITRSPIACWTTKRFRARRASSAIFATAWTSNHVTAYRAVATAAAREARNYRTLMERIRRKSGIELEVISSEEEARLVCSAVKWALGDNVKPRLIFDLGGGSLELNFFERGDAAASAWRCRWARSA